ncbi:MAG: endonuclease domain-containing protein [Hyphomicrobiales bacterium]|nr:endonuclease domain-containing protein [Hyphomicrobiales bacterium]
MPHRQVADIRRAHAKRMRSTMSDAERALWQRLRAHRFRGLGFRRQVPVGPYIADFVCQEARLVIELDGGQHGVAGEVLHDRRRTAWLAGRGYRILRFWNDEVLKNMDGVLRRIEEELRDTPPSRSTASRRPDLPLKGGGVWKNRR